MVLPGMVYYNCPSVFARWSLITRNSLVTGTLKLHTEVHAHVRYAPWYNTAHMVIDSMHHSDDGHVQHEISIPGTLNIIGGVSSPTTRVTRTARTRHMHSSLEALAGGWSVPPCS